MNCIQDITPSLVKCKYVTVCDCGTQLLGPRSSHEEEVHNEVQQD
jgi:hypothetical protein